MLKVVWEPATVDPMLSDSVGRRKSSKERVLFEEER